MDYYIFQQINNLAGKNWFLDQFGIFCAEYLIFVLFFAAIVFCFIYWRNKSGGERLMAKILLTASASWLINQAIGLIYFRPRPFVHHQVVQLVAKEAASKSFPSDHTALVFAFAFCVYFFNKKAGVVFLFLAFLVGLNRIYAGIHYPVDVLAGIVIAFLVAILIDKMLSKVKAQNEKVEP